MNADDQFHSNAILQFIENEIIHFNNQIKLVYGIAKIIDDNLQLSYLKGREVSLRDFYWNQPIVHQSTFYKKEVFRDIGFYNENLIGVGDYEWYVRFFNTFSDKNANFINITIANFSMGGVTSEILWQNFCDRRKIANKYFPIRIKIKYFYASPFYYLKFKVLSALKNTSIYRKYRHIKFSL
jgi:hypothetical protein